MNAGSRLVPDCGVIMVSIQIQNLGDPVLFGCTTIFIFLVRLCRDEP